MKTWFDESLDPELVKALKLKIKVQGKQITRDFMPDLVVDYDLLLDQLADTPSIYVFWATIYSECKKEVAILKRQSKFRRSILNNEIINQQRDAGVVLRADDVRNLIEGDEVLNKLEAKIIQAEAKEGVLYNILLAIRMRSDHLRSLSGFKRMEFKDSDS